MVVNLGVNLGLEQDDSDASLTQIFEEEPVALDVFIKDKKFLGQTNIDLSDIQADAVRHIERIYYPDLYPRMAEEFNNPYWAAPIPMRNLITVQWGKGGGKDAISRYASLRVAYLLLCLKSPQIYFEMPEIDSIHLLNIAANAPQATRAFFKPMTQAVKRGWFKDRADPKQGVIEYDKNIEAVSGHSDAEGQEGLNIMLGVADEIDAFKAKDEMVGQGKRAREASTSAESILDMIKTSASTRFPDTYKRVAISYPRYLGSTIQRLTHEGRESNAKYGEKSIHYVSGPYATWDVNPRVSGKEKYAEDYDKDPDAAAAKYECKPKRAADPYFRHMDIFKQAVVAEEQPLKVDYRITSVKSTTTGKTTSGWEPIFIFADDFVPIQGARYAMHGDLAVKGDRAGIAMSHVVRFEERDEIVEAEDGEHIQMTEVVPIIKNDFTIAFEADVSAKPYAREIQIRWARMLAFELIKRGFLISRFTFDGFQCLSGDTKIPLLNGTTKTMRELEGSDPFWVYSIKDGRIVPGLVTKAWKTGWRDDMLEVELDNGEVVRSTSDHRFMLRDGTYRMAAELSPGDSLMPLYRRDRKVSPTSCDYEQVWHPEADGSGKRWRFTHSMVSHFMYGKLPKGWVTHHIDHTKKNNSPDNLVQLTNEEHYEVHTAALHLDTFRKKWADPEWREEHKLRISSAQSRSQLGKTGSSSRRYRHDVSFQDIERVHAEIHSSGRIPTKEAMRDVLGISQDLLYARVRENGYGSWKRYRDAHEPVSAPAMYMRDWKRKKKVVNHKVVAVRPAPPEDVYDFEVEDHHNFATEAGVFVHNSVDTIQILTRHGVESERVSCDINDNVWKNLKDVASEGRLQMPFNQILMNEIEALSRINGKVDHPPGGGKDCADAFAASITGAIVAGGEEDADGNQVDVGESYFGVGTSLTPLEGTGEVFNSFGSPFGLPIGMKGMGLHG